MKAKLCLALPVTRRPQKASLVRQVSTRQAEDKASATLPPEIQQKITQKRKAGDADAAIDPFAQPDVKAALQRTSFELLVGFNLTQDQLKYNATR